METSVQQSPSSCLRVVLYGPESTGKTTLAKALAAHYNTQWVPEFARDYLQQKWEREQAVCSLDDLLPIAFGQLSAENQALKKAQDLLFCDTNCWVTKVWSETHFDGYCDPQLLDLCATTQYDLYLLTQIDLPWVKDDLRDRPDQREQMFHHFKQQLIDHQLPFIEVGGTQQHRLENAIEQLDNWRKKNG